MDQLKNDSQEKRSFTRIKTDTPAEVLICGRDKRFKALCRDMSGNGMLMESRVGLKIGTEIEVKLLSHFGDPLLKARCTVARLERNSAGNYVLGLEISEMLD